MRIIQVVLLCVAWFVATGISTASAQRASSSSSSSSSSADAARAPNAAARAQAEAIATGRPLTASQFTDFSINGSNMVRAAPPRTPEQQKADAEASAAWQARCRPTVVVDREGLRRVQYAEPDCDLSRFNTAGAQ
jgi:hypothetical protein